MRKDPTPPKVIKIDPADVIGPIEFATFDPEFDDEEVREVFGRGVTLIKLADTPTYHAAMPGDIFHLNGIRYTMIGRQPVYDGVIFQCDQSGPIPAHEL